MKNIRRLIIILIALGLFTSNIIVGAFIPRVIALTNTTYTFSHSIHPGTYFTFKSSKYSGDQLITGTEDEMIIKTNKSIIIVSNQKHKTKDGKEIPYTEYEYPLTVSPNYEFRFGQTETIDYNQTLLVYYSPTARNTLIRIYEIPDQKGEWYIPGEPVYLTPSSISKHNTNFYLVIKSGTLYKIYRVTINGYTEIGQSTEPIIGAGYGNRSWGERYATPHSIFKYYNEKTSTVISPEDLNNLDIKELKTFHIDKLTHKPGNYYWYNFLYEGVAEKNDGTKVIYYINKNNIAIVGTPPKITNLVDAIRISAKPLAYAVYDGQSVYAWYPDTDAIEYLFAIKGESGFSNSFSIYEDPFDLFATKIGPYFITSIYEPFSIGLNVSTKNLENRIIPKNKTISYQDIIRLRNIDGDSYKLYSEIFSGNKYIKIGKLEEDWGNWKAPITINGANASVPENGLPIAYRYRIYTTTDLRDLKATAYFDSSNIYAEYYSYLFMFDPGKVTKYPEVIMEYENKTTNNFVLGNSIGTVKISNTGETPETIKCFSTRKYVKFDTSTITISPGETKEIQILPAFDIKDYNVLYRDTITCQWRLGILKQDIVYTLGKIEYKINPSDIKVSASNESVETYKDWINNEISLNIPYPSNAKETKIVIEPQNTFYGTITAGDKTYKINGNDIITIPVPPGGITITVNLENNPENKHPYLDIYQKYMGESILLGELDLGYAHYINDSAQIDINSYYIHPNYLTAYISQGGVYDLLTQIEYYYYNNNFINLRNNILSLFASNKESFSINIYDPNSNKEKELIEYNNKKLIYPIISIEKEGKKYMSLTDLQNQLSDIGITITFESATRINISGAILEHGQYNWRPASY